MKFTFIINVLLMIPFFGQSQFEHKGITVDGSVNYKELNDTLQWETIVREPHVIIRESNDSYYLAVVSNTYTSVNLYVDCRPSMIKALHASYSLGDAIYTKIDEGQWSAIDGVADEVSGKKVYDWKFRDPVLRDSSEKNNIPIEMDAFYAENLWVSNTMPMGSFREVELLLSKKLVTNVDNIILTYLYKVDEGKQICVIFRVLLSRLPGILKSIVNFKTGIFR